MDQYTKLPLGDDFYKTLLDCLFDAVFTVNVDGIITYWNDGCVRLTGFSSDEVMGLCYRKAPFYWSDQEGGSQTGGIQMVLERGMPGTWKGYVNRKNGQRIPVDSHIAPLQDKQGSIIGAVEVLRDISAHVALEQAHQQVLQISRRDQLTGLNNRGALNELLKAEVGRSRRYQQPLSVIMIDIDHFKRVNDLYGHEAGDRVLARFGSILLHNLRQPDMVGRWGGEEFLIVAPGSDSAAAEKLAERIRGIIKAVEPHQIPEPVTASFGVAQLTERQSLDQLLFVADMAMYTAKNNGRDRVVIGTTEQYPANGSSPRALS